MKGLGNAEGAAESSRSPKLFVQVPNWAGSLVNSLLRNTKGKFLVFLRKILLIACESLEGAQNRHLGTHKIVTVTSLDFDLKFPKTVGMKCDFRAI